MTNREIIPGRKKRVTVAYILISSVKVLAALA